MGIFSSFGNALKKGAEFVGKAVGAVVSAVTEVGRLLLKVLAMLTTECRIL